MLWSKIRRDLLTGRSRTALVVLSTCAGIFALGLVIALSTLIRERVGEDHRSRVPGEINFWRVGPFDEGVVEAVSREPGVLDAEGQTHLAIRWKPVGSANWLNGILVVRDDYEAQRMDLLDLVEGTWPTRRTLAVERQTAQYFGLALGESILVERERSQASLALEGLLRMPIGLLMPPRVGGDATFFATAETAAWLTGHEGFNQLNIRLVSYDETAAREIAESIERRLAQMGISVGSYTITDPQVHWLQSQADAIFLVLGIIAGLSLILSGFLIVNTINATIARQVWQIGVMKVVGATSGHVAVTYLAIALAYGLLALLPAIPLGSLAAHGMANWLLDLMGIAGGAWHLVPAAVAIQLAVGGLVPVAAALLPTLGAARITPHQAISRYGLGSGFGQGKLDRMVGRVHFLPRLLALALRNAFRNQGRTALTVSTLALAGVMFIAVSSVSGSLDETLETLAAEFGFDVLVALTQPVRIGTITHLTESLEGVEAAEVWDYRTATLQLPDRAPINLPVWGVPADSELFTPRLVGGRPLLPGDSRSLLLNSRIAADEGVEVGDRVTLSFAGYESSWSVVGLVLSTSGYQHDSFVPLDALATEVGRAGYGTVVAVAAEPGAAAGLVARLKQAYDRRFEVSAFRSIDEIKEENRAQFEVMTVLMQSMSVLAAVVGSVGLASAMSINVVERRREIAVMRAVGASSPAVASVFIAEGTFLGELAWLMTVPPSVPAAALFASAVGEVLFRYPLAFRYAANGALLWLAIVVALSALGSLWPALQASRVSIREALAYE